MEVQLPEERIPLKSILGKVNDATGLGLAGAFVEIYKDSTRIAGCEVGSNGRFSFGHIPSGKYELRISKKYFDTVSQNVRIRRKTGWQKALSITVNVGQ